MQVITRFAPSPTGFLHVGNVRTALVNWLFAKAHNGKFILRIDDTDTQRSKEEYTLSIKEDLKWLGLSWDEIYFQSKRTKKYEEIKQRLITEGKLYPCYETPEELEVKRKMLLSRNKPPIYDRAALKLTEQQKQDFEAQGIKSHWRFYMEDKPIEWQDRIRGEVKFQGSNISDPILVRADGTLTYMIASVLDDIEFGITDIIRGEDHITNTAIHINLMKALGAKSIPSFAHLSLLKTKGEELSKRKGGFDIRSLCNAGIEAMPLLSLLAKMGSSDSIDIAYSIEELIKEFDVTKYGKATVTYDEEELERLNARYLHNVPFEKVKDKILKLNFEQVDKDFWEAVRPNINKLPELETWVNICKKEIEPKITNPEVTNKAAELLPEDFGSNPSAKWKEWISNIKSETNQSGKSLFMPLRLALTGMDNGPELKIILQLLGYKKSYMRLTGQKS